MADKGRQNILLTGKPGCGKTTVVQRVAAELGERAGGFYSREIRKNAIRTGFSIRTLDGREGMLAGVKLKSPHRVGRYGVNVRDVDLIVVPSIRDAVRAGKIVVIDEIAFMELFSSAFREAVTEALDSSSPVLATLQIRRDPFLEALRKRADCLLLTCTPASRSRLPDEVLHLLHSGFPE
jgi:nucleoside-triphosphatase